MAIDIVKTTECGAPLEVVFAYVADYRNVPDWLFGVQSFEPVGEVDHGLGAVFDGAMHLGVTLRSRIEVNAWEDDRLIGFDSVKGFKNSSRWTFERLGDGGTRIIAEVSYSLPFGPAGKALGKVIEPFVKQAVAHSSQHLKEQVEKAARAR
jgi:uncharacterized membrane protein